jgi:hypothetical protein
VWRARTVAASLARQFGTFEAVRRASVDDVESVVTLPNDDGANEVVILRFAVPDYRILHIDGIWFGMERGGFLYGDFGACEIAVFRPGPTLYVRNFDDEWWLVNDPDHEPPEPDD